MQAKEIKKILIVCTGNSIRSQIAEGFFRSLKPEWEILSAGVAPLGVNPLAVEIMKEIDIDISGQTSNQVNEYLEYEFDYVITVCDNAKENCPYFPNAGEYIHWSFRDPASSTGSGQDRLRDFRKVRDQIKKEILAFIE